MALCPTCGNSVSTDATICSDCGMDLTSMAPPTDQSASSRAAELSAEILTPEAIGFAVLTLKRAGILTDVKYAVGIDVILGRFDTESGPVDVDFAPLPEATYISRHHARLRRASDGQWTIQDLGSRNGTYVKSGEDAQFIRTTGEHGLNDGDEIALGNARFVFSINHSMTPEISSVD